MRGVAADQTKVAPYRYEPGFLVDDSVSEPVGIFSAFTATIDKRASEDVVAFHFAITRSGFEDKGSSPSPGDAMTAAVVTIYDLESKSRISVKSVSSAEGLGGSAGLSSSFFFIELRPLITMKIAKAMITKSSTVLINMP